LQSNVKQEDRLEFLQVCIVAVIFAGWAILHLSVQLFRHLFWINGSYILDRAQVGTISVFQ
jgi:hypothetical protein